MRRGLLFLSAVVIALALVPAATASKPARETVAAPDDMVFTDQCAFSVLGHIEGGEINTTFTGKAGNPLLEELSGILGAVKLLGVFPGQRLTVTNLVTGKSITLVNSGSFQARAEPDGSVTIQITGRGPLPNFVTGEPGLPYLGGGRVLLTFDARGNLTSIDTAGRVLDLCTQLAP